MQSDTNPKSSPDSCKRSPVAVHAGIYLPRSMTFVHRQLVSMAALHPTIVLTEDLRNLEMFPFAPIYFQPKNLADRASHRLYTWLTRRYIGLGLWQRRVWAGVLRAHGSRLVHANFGVGGLQVLGLCQSLKLPLLVSFRGVDASRMLNNPRYVRSLRALFDYAHLIVMSHSMGDRLVGLGADPQRTHYLPTGISLEDFPLTLRRPLREKSQANEAITFLQVSTFKEKKGHLITLRAFKEFLPSYPRSTLIFAGDGDLLPSAKALSAELGLGQQVKFLGEVSPAEVQSLLPAADVFVHHSVTASDGNQEGTPNAILEAMATGLPVISSYHAGIPEVITDGQNGYLVAERDVLAYANKMRAVLHDDGSIGRRAAQTICGTLDIRQQNEKLSQIYETIIHSWSTSI